MVDTLLRSDQGTQAVIALGSNRARISDDDRGLCGRDAGDRVDGRAERRAGPALTSADELRCPMPEHHDAGVRAAAGYRRQHRSVDHP
jgi:hypothetical protein